MFFRHGIKNIARLRMIVLGSIAAVLAGILLLATYNSRVAPSQSGTQSPLPAAYPINLYTVARNGVISIRAYDAQLGKHYELEKVPGSSTVGQKAFFSADYHAPSNQIAYTDQRGLTLFSVTDGTSRLLVKSEIASASPSTATVYTKPLWSDDGSQLLTGVGYYEGSGFRVISQDGSVTKPSGIGDEAFGSVRRWLPGGGYLVGSASEFGGAFGFKQAVATDLATLTAVTPKGLEGYGPADFVVTKGDKDVPLVTAIVRTSIGTTTQRMRLVQFSLDSTTPAVIGIASPLDTLDNPEALSLVADSKGTVYLGYSTPDWVSAIVRVDAPQETVVPVLSKLDGQVSLTTATSESLFYSFTQAGPNDRFQSLTTLSSLDIATTKITTFGKAADITTFGSMLTTALPSYAKVVAESAASQEESAAYDASFKTRGYLASSFYDACWEFDCQSKDLPYPARKPTIPQIVQVNRNNGTLAGAVSVPVYIVYRGSTKPSQTVLDVVKDSSIVGSPGWVVNKINVEAAKTKVALTVSLDIQPEAVALPETCVDNQVKGECLMQQLQQKFSATNGAPFSYALFLDQVTSQANAGIYTTATSFSENPAQGVPKSREMHILPLYYSTTSGEYTTDQVKVQYTSSLAAGFAYTSFVRYYGVTDRFSYSSLAGFASNAPAPCVIGVSTDAGCATAWSGSGSSRTVTFVDVQTLKLSALNTKELGWTDEDGDGAVEALDTCPYDATDTCKR